MKYSNAIQNIANQIKVFEFATERMKKVVPELATDKDLYEALGTTQSTFATWKKRGTIQPWALIDFCTKYRVNMNWFFAGIGHPLLGSVQEQQSVSSIESSVQDGETMEDVIKQAMVNILPEMERANLAFSDKSLHKMIKTYLRFKDKGNTDISMLLRAVAEVEAED